MTRRTLAITIDGDVDDVFPAVIEEVADQMVTGKWSGHVPVMDGVDWTMEELATPAAIDRRQQRAAALLLLAVGGSSTLQAIAGSMQQATWICQGLTAADLPEATEEGRREALREARRLINAMLADQP